MKTFCRIVTAEGRAAIAVVRVWGPAALAVVDSVFRPHRGAAMGGTKAGRLRLGRAGVGVGDEVVAVLLEDSPPTLELHCHGGTAAVAAVVRSLQDAGAVVATRLPGGLLPTDDRIRAEAMEDLAAAPTLRAAEILLDQGHGALSRSLERLVGEARRESELGPKSPIVESLDALVRAAEVGTRLLGGWKVVIAGRPNVGKSRLFNAMAGFERSIVNPRAGVTRDVVSVRTALGGWPIELADTAGERETADALERIGIGRARQERGGADLVVLVLDRSEPLQEVDRRLLGAMSSAVVVANKCDLEPAWNADAIGRDASELFSISAETGEGLDRLVRGVESRLVPHPPEPGAAVPFRREQRDAIEKARACVVGGDLEGFVRRLESIRRWAGDAGPAPDAPGWSQSS